MDEEIVGDPYPCVTLRALAKAYGWERCGSLDQPDPGAS